MREVQLRPAEDLPEVHVSLVLIRTGAEALIEVMGPRKGRRFLRSWVRRVAHAVSMGDVVPMRPARDRAAVLRARRQALAWLESVEEAMIASLPPED